MCQCGNNNELALQDGGFCTTWSLAAKGLFAYFTMKNSSFAWIGLFCSCVDDVSIRRQMFNSVFLPPKRWFQLNSRKTRAHFSSIMTSNNWEMIAETRGYIFRWRSRSRRRRVCLHFELRSYSRWHEESPAFVVKLYRNFHHRRRRPRHHGFLHGIPASFQGSPFFPSSLSLQVKERRGTLRTRLQGPFAHNKNGTITFWTILYSSTNVYPESRVKRDINHLTMKFWQQTWSSLKRARKIHAHARDSKSADSRAFFFSISELKVPWTAMGL